MSTTQQDSQSASIMRDFINYFIKNPIAGNLLMIGLFLIGILGLMNMKSTFFPEEDSKLISIQVVYPGASPEEIEEGVVNKVEENLRGLTGVDRITSVSSENAGSVSVEVAKGYDTDIILQDVKNAVDRISSFPAFTIFDRVFGTYTSLCFVLVLVVCNVGCMKTFTILVLKDLAISLPKLNLLLICCKISFSTFLYVYICCCPFKFA